MILRTFVLTILCLKNPDYTKLCPTKQSKVTQVREIVYGRCSSMEPQEWAKEKNCCRCGDSLHLPGEWCTALHILIDKSMLKQYGWIQCSHNWVTNSWRNGVKVLRSLWRLKINCQSSRRRVWDKEWKLSSISSSHYILGGEIHGVLHRPHIPR